MKVFNTLLLLLFAGSVGAATVTMINTGAIGAPGYYLFNIDNVPYALICDQFVPNVATGPYTATVSTLSDISLTYLSFQNDPNALRKYQWVGMLVAMAFADPTNIQLATDVTWANRRIVDGAGPLPGNAHTLYDFVLTQDPIAYDLSGFRIYTATPNPLISQEQTGFFVSSTGESDVPEPSMIVLFGLGIAGITIRRLFHTRKML
jgi:hypothetical protein